MTGHSHTMTRRFALLTAALLISCENENAASQQPQAEAERLSTVSSNGENKESGVVESSASLSSREINELLTGKMITYSPPGWADAGVHEEFHEGGEWRGIRYSRGPVPFSGQWFTKENKLCVTSPRTISSSVSEGAPFCREVRLAKGGRQILIAHIAWRDQEMMVAEVQSLQTR